MKSANPDTASPSRLKADSGTIFLILLSVTLPFVRTIHTAEPENNIRYLIFGFILALTTFLVFLQKRKTGITLSSSPHFKWLLMVGIITVLSSLMSFHFWEGAYETSKILMQIWCFVLLLFFLSESPSFLNSAQHFILFTFLCIAIIGCYQIAETILSSEGDLSLFTLNTNLHSTFSNKNFFGETLALLLPLLVASLLNNSGVLRTLSAISVLVCLMLILLIKSLAVTAGCAAGSFALLWLLYTAEGKSLFKKLSRKQVVILMLLLTMSLAAFLILFRKDTSVTGYSHKISLITDYIRSPEKTTGWDEKQNDNSVYERLLLIRKSAQMYGDAPVTGMGLANWRIYFPKYGISGSPYLDSGRLRYEHPHNDYLFILCETGPLGLVSWLLLLILTVAYGYKSLRSEKITKNHKNIIAACISLLLTFSVISLFSYPRERFYTLFLVMLSAALITALGINTKRKAYSISRASLIIIILFLSASVYLHAIHVKNELFLRAASNRQVQKDFPAMQAYLHRVNDAMFPLDFTSTPVAWYKGMAHYYQNDTAKALEGFKQAVEDNPYHLQAWCDYSALLEKTGQYASAFAAIRNAAALNPVYDDVLLNTGVLYAKTGNIDSAFYFLRQYKPKYSKPYKAIMSDLLAYKVGVYAQQHNDTLLVEKLNRKIINHKFFLAAEYNKAGQNDSVFIRNLLIYKNK